MKLYYTPKACSLAIHIALCEANVNYSLEAVNLSNKITASGKDFYDINPKGQVPALMLDDNKTVLTEVAAILQYIADLVPSTKLIVPIGEIERYKIIAWINFVATELHKNFMPLFKPSSAQEKIKASEQLNTKFAYLEAHLEKHSYLQNNHFTIADCYLFVILNWREIIPTLTSYPAIDSYIERISQRPAVIKAIQEES
ncbi:MAG: glutathione transferase GstA [Candidatus Schmidhempelia sp.]|nr:glutathione transferase GstA [Candidatus Schmidhempelia sp.]